MIGENPFKNIKIPAKESEKREVKKENGPVVRRAISKPKLFLESLGISDYSYEEKDDGVHFLIKLPQEHIEERKLQKSRLGDLDPTNFTREKIMPFIKSLMDDEKLSYKIIDPESPDSWVFEVVVFKKRK